MAFYPTGTPGSQFSGNMLRPSGPMPMQAPQGPQTANAIPQQRPMPQGAMPMRPGMPLQRPNLSPQQLRALMMIMARRRAMAGGQAPARALLGVR